MTEGHKFSAETEKELHDVVHRIKTWQFLKLLAVEEDAQKNPGYIAGYSSTRSDFGLHV